MIQLDKTLKLIDQQNWQELSNLIDKLLGDKNHAKSQKQMFTQTQSNWLNGFIEEKITIIKQLDKKLQILHQSTLKSDNTQKMNNFSESVIKYFAKGLILPQLNRYEDINFFHKFISSSKNAKYLFMLFQQNLYEMYQIYDQQSVTVIEKVNLKALSMISGFVKLAGLNIFADILKKFHQFQGAYRKIQSEEKIIGETDKQLTEFFNIFLEKTLNQLRKLTDNNLNFNTIKKLSQKKLQRKQLFELLKLLYSQHSSHNKQIKEIVSVFIKILQLGLKQFQELPSFWISDNLEALKIYYNNEHLFYILGSILINELPSRPQYSQIQNHLFILLEYVLVHISSKNQPIKSLNFGSCNDFYVKLFQRFSILMGLLNNKDQNQLKINQMIKYLLNKKDLFSSLSLVEILWREIFLLHEDFNFKIFCLGQYKKVLFNPVKQITSLQMHIFKNGCQFIQKVVLQLEANSNAQFIGNILTLVIYCMSFLKKIQNFRNLNNQQMSTQTNQQKRVILVNYMLCDQKIYQIKQKIRQKLSNLKQGLKDRLQVYKMKNKPQEVKTVQKQANQISICIYRIEQEVKFD